MPINPEHLLSFPIPPVTHIYGPAEIALYALSIGMGQDPMDLRQLTYLGAAGVAPKAMPAIVNVLGHPGFWLADPATGVDALKVVHGEQGMTLHHPVPPQGQVTAQTQVTGLIDKGPGRGALLYTEKTLHNADGTLLATCRGTTFLRSDGGFGGAAGPARVPHQVPDTAPDHVFDTPTRPEQALLYRWNGDPNPLHLDPAVAARAGFPRPILHGLCSFGCAAHALLAVLCDYDDRRFGAMDARFTAHVFPGETLRTEIWADGSFRARAVERDVIVIGNGRFQHREVS